MDEFEDKLTEHYQTTIKAIAAGQLTLAFFFALAAGLLLAVTI